MKNIWRVGILVSLFFLVSFVAHPLLAQGTNLTKVKSEMVELNIDAVYIPCEDPTSELCVEFPDAGVHPYTIESKHDHEIGVSADGFIPNTEVYIVGCIDTISTTHCTTGSVTLDAQLNQMPGGDTMSPDPSHEFRVSQNPVKSDAEGNISVIVRSFTPQTTRHSFNAYSIEEQDLNAVSKGQVSSVAPEEALHLQNFNIDVPTPAPVRRPRRTPIRQRGVTNDPKGRLFDAKSLEPLPGTEVTLLDNFKQLYVEEKFINPLNVLDNGEFNFWVPNGIYYLSISRLPATHTWPMELPQVHPNYSLAYYCDPDVKDEATSETVPLYYEQFSIIEYNKLVHCDVPTNPGTNTPYRSQVKALNYGVSRSTSDDTLNYSGKVTHPFTKVELLGEANGSVISEIEADKLGYWAMSIAPANYPLDQSGLPDKVEVRYTKRDLTAELQFQSVKGASFDPLLRYIEGYSYDEQGKIIPMAEVGVKQKNADTVVYLTTADANGFFKIGSQYLPTLPYDLVFTDPQKQSSIRRTTSEFVLANKSYLTEKQLNLASAENRDVPLTVTKTMSYGQLNPQKQADKPSGMSEEVAPQSNKNSFVVIVLSFIGLIVLGGLVAVKLSRNKTISSSNNPY